MSFSVDDEVAPLTPVSYFNPNISCLLCKGYLIDATTITECLHSFCKSCIVIYFRNHYHCPHCSIEVHPTKPYQCLRPDQRLQEIVYSLVPGLWINEMERRRKFYSKNPIATTSKSLSDEGSSSGPCFTSEDMISYSMEPNVESETIRNKKKRYYFSQAGIPVRVLAKLLLHKYEVHRAKVRLEVSYQGQVISGETTLAKIANKSLIKPGDGILKLEYRFIGKLKWFKTKSKAKKV